MHVTQLCTYVHRILPVPIDQRVYYMVRVSSLLWIRRRRMKGTQNHPSMRRRRAPGCQPPVRQLRASSNSPSKESISFLEENFFFCINTQVIPQTSVMTPMQTDQWRKVITAAGGQMTDKAYRVPGCFSQDVIKVITRPPSGIYPRLITF